MDIVKLLDYETYLNIGINRNKKNVCFGTLWVDFMVKNIWFFLERQYNMYISLRITFKWFYEKHFILYINRVFDYIVIIKKLLLLLFVY